MALLKPFREFLYEKKEQPQLNKKKDYVYKNDSLKVYKMKDGRYEISLTLPVNGINKLILTISGNQIEPYKEYYYSIKNLEKDEKFSEFVKNSLSAFMKYIKEFNDFRNDMIHTAKILNVNLKEILNGNSLTKLFSKDFLDKLKTHEEAKKVFGEFFTLLKKYDNEKYISLYEKISKIYGLNRLNFTEDLVNKYLKNSPVRFYELKTDKNRLLKFSFDKFSRNEPLPSSVEKALKDWDVFTSIENLLLNWYVEEGLLSVYKNVILPLLDIENSPESIFAEKVLRIITYMKRKKNFRKIVKNK